MNSKPAILVAIFTCLIAISTFSQAPESKWTVGTITKVQLHSGGDTNTPTYDISVKVGDTVYVVQYTQDPGTTLVQYREGSDAPVLVGEKTLTVTDAMGVTREVPIISRSPAPPKTP